MLLMCVQLAAGAEMGDALHVVSAMAGWGWTAMLPVDDAKAAVVASGGHSGLMELDAVKPVSSLFVLLVAVWPVTSLGGTSSCPEECCVE